MSNRSFNALLNVFGDNLAASICVAMPGRVTAYEREKHRASVQPLLRRVYADGRADDMPVIPGVPVIFPQAGGAVLDFPVAKGDTVLLVFADRALDTWLASGDMATPPSLASHTLSDAIAIPGLRAFNGKPIPNAGNDVILSYAGAVFRLKEDGDVELSAPKVKIVGDVEVDGDVTASGDVKAGTVSLQHHIHSGVQGGAGNTGQPVT